MDIYNNIGSDFDPYNELIKHQSAIHLLLSNYASLNQEVSSLIDILNEYINLQHESARQINQLNIEILKLKSGK